MLFDFGIKQSFGRIQTQVRAAYSFACLTLRFINLQKNGFIWSYLAGIEPPSVKSASGLPKESLFGSLKQVFPAVQRDLEPRRARPCTAAWQGACTSWSRNPMPLAWWSRISGRPTRAPLPLWTQSSWLTGQPAGQALIEISLCHPCSGLPLGLDPNSTLRSSTSPTQTLGRAWTGAIKLHLEAWNTADTASSMNAHAWYGVC